MNPLPHADIPFEKKMQAIPLERSSHAQTVVVSLATTAALALLGLVLAYWTWAWLAPRPEPRAPEAAHAAGRVQAAYALFGSAQRDRAGAAPTGIAIRLVGVVAATRGRRGYAVLQLEAKENVAVREGEDVAPGIRLAEVGADRVTLERAGIRETLAWPEKGGR
jgi:general secretion pathway protein C